MNDIDIVPGFKARVISACDGSSAARKLLSVFPENTTPQPNVSSGPLRFMRMAKYIPAGPPPMS